MLILLRINFVFRRVFDDSVYEYLITNTCGTKPLLNNYDDDTEVKVDSQGKYITVFWGQTIFKYWTFHLLDGKHMPVLLGSISKYFNLYPDDSKMSLIPYMCFSSLKLCDSKLPM